MASVSIDTVKLRECGNDVMQLSANLNEVLNELYKRIDSMPEKTLEWTGSSAQRFVQKVDVEKIEYLKLKQIIYDYGKYLVVAADRYDDAARKNGLN